MSVVGSQVTVLVIPLVAVLTLHVSTFVVGLLAFLAYLPYLLIGLPAGVWVDRLSPRAVMIAADVLRAVTLLSIPLAHAFGVLTLGQLALVVFVNGAAGTVFDVAYQSFVPAVLTDEELVAGNARLESTLAIAQAGGPSIGGGLVQLLSAPLALLADGASFVVSFVSILSIPRVPAVSRTSQRHVIAEIREGVTFVRSDTNLSAIAACSATVNFSGAGVTALSIVFLVRDVHLSSGIVGLLISSGLLGASLGALLAGRVAQRLGSARALRWSTSLFVVGLLVPGTAAGARVGFFVVGMIAVGLGSGVYNVIQVTYRQQCCGREMLARVNATMRSVAWGAMPFGGLMAGLLGNELGNRPTLWLLEAIGAASGFWLWRSPMRRATELVAA